MNVCLYMRVARKDAEEENNIFREQEELLRRYARENDYTVKDVVCDIGSGLNMDREGIIEILNASSDEYEIVMAKDVSRISRNPIDVLKWVELLEQNGKRLVTADGSYERFVEQSKLLQSRFGDIMTTGGK